MNQHLIVLCAGNPTLGTIGDISDKSGYIGPAVRYAAAAKHIREKFQDYHKIILVGGRVDNYPKAKAMWHWMAHYEPTINSNHILPKVVFLVSDPDTTGNVVAVRRYWNFTGLPTAAHILTNKYHLPRSMAFFHDMYGVYHPVQFKKIIAEEVLCQYPTDPNIQPQVTLRLQNEANGLEDWNWRRYNRQNEFFFDDLWTCEIHNSNPPIILRRVSLHDLTDNK